MNFIRLKKYYLFSLLRLFQQHFTSLPVGPRAVSMIDSTSSSDNSMFPDIESSGAADDTGVQLLADEPVSSHSCKRYLVNLVTKFLSNLQVQLSKYWSH